MTRFLIIVATVATTLVTAAHAAKPKTEEDKIFYALGLAISQNLARYELSAKELDMVQTGMADGVKGKDPVVDLEEYGPKLAELARTRAESAAAKEAEASAEFMVAQAKKDGAQSFDSGLVYFEIATGDGPKPRATDTVQVHYHGTLRDGTVFDSSVERGTPATFPLNRVIPCWTEAVQKMNVGGKAKLVCPADIAYGERGSPPRIAPNAALVFEVELLGIQDQSGGS